MRVVLQRVSLAALLFPLYQVVALHDTFRVGVKLSDGSYGGENEGQWQMTPVFQSIEKGARSAYSDYATDSDGVNPDYLKLVLEPYGETDGSWDALDYINDGYDFRLCVEISSGDSKSESCTSWASHSDSANEWLTSYWTELADYDSVRLKLDKSSWFYGYNLAVQGLRFGVQLSDSAGRWTPWKRGSWCWTPWLYRRGAYLWTTYVGGESPWCGDSDGSNPDNVRVAMKVDYGQSYSSSSSKYSALPTKEEHSSILDLSHDPFDKIVLAAAAIVALVALVVLIRWCKFRREMKDRYVKMEEQASVETEEHVTQHDADSQATLAK